MDITIIIKTINRYQSLNRLITSIFHYYPLISVIVADDTREQKRELIDPRCEHICLPYDVGVSRGRNIAVNSVKTKYVLTCDDDFEFTENTKIEKFVEILKTGCVDIIGGAVVDFGTNERVYHGRFIKLGGKLIMKMNERVGGNKEVNLYDFIPQFFMCETKLLQEYSWCDELKTMEHVEFFWRLKQGNVKIGYDRSVAVDHHPFSESGYRRSEYERMRLDRAEYYWSRSKQIMEVEDVQRQFSSNILIDWKPLSVFQFIFRHLETRKGNNWMYKSAYTILDSIKPIFMKIMGRR